MQKDYSWNSSTHICENSRYLKGVADGVAKCVINVTDTVSANVVTTVPIDSDDKKIRYKMVYYILHTFLLVTIILFMFTTISYHCAKLRSKKKCTGKSAI